MTAQRQGNTKVSRDDWVIAALEVLIEQGVERVKILDLSERLQVSRSSFYWYFKDREALLDALLEVWSETNTKSFVEACRHPAHSVTEGVCQLFRCFVDPALFDPQLDFAVRDWARRSEAVRRVVDAADAERVTALTEMFARYDYSAEDAAMRARVLYYMQIGYYALELRESLEERLARTPGYVRGFTGREPVGREMAALEAYALAARDRHLRTEDDNDA